MKRKTILSLVTAVGIVVLIVLEAFSSYLSHHGYDAEKIEVAVLAAVILLVVNMVFHFSSIQAEAIIEHIAEFERQMMAHVTEFEHFYLQSHEGRITILTSTEMYKHLKAAVLSAKNRIYTCYFGEYPPGETPSEKKDYHNTILQIAKKKPNISIRRVLLFTPRNLPWIRRMIAECANLPNKSLAVYCLAPGTSLPLSLQLIDQARLILVNPASRAPGQRRDISISDGEAVQLMDGYYERIWKNSEVVVLKGEIQEDAVRKLESMYYAKGLLSDSDEE